MVNWIVSACYTLSLGLASVAVAQEQVERQSAESTASSTPTLVEALLFQPAKFPQGNWTPRGLEFTDEELYSADGTKLHGWYCPCPNPRANILLLHGNAGHVASRAAWLKHLQAELRVSTFILDYRGYGKSEGVATVAGALADARAAQQRLCELANIPASEILIMGDSLGGAFAIHLAAETAPRGLILQSTFTSLREIAEIHFPQYSWVVPVDQLDSLEKLANYHGPLLQSHGTADRTIPISNGHRLFQAAQKQAPTVPRSWIAVRGAGHNNWMSPDYLAKLDEFVEQVHQAAH
ncbi:alpha/beta hydrolase [Aureliella helgolandensis]|uniref:Alpha/beta hydrolase family protein n=1 Tax=Aureliella helgolandensis TaxID=2527968 RepID=A0A518G031_9BACT|nr:alpha/beta hydrolase [Aureliella helgolandensis]QDV21926.1 Alpha/beta hydrolase family protein [Aureliella helgolandensis]